MHVAEPEQKSRARRPRWFQFSLRTLLLLTFAAAIVFSWIGYEGRITAYREALLEEQFGSPWPEASWSGKCLVALEFNSISKPRMLERLKSFPDLRKLVIWFNHELRDDQLTHVGGLPQLVELDLRGTKITDKGIAHLNDLPSLVELSLCGTRISDEAIIYVGRFTHLRKLDLGATRITDAGLEHLSGLTNLRELWIHETQVTDDGPKTLQQRLPHCVVHR